MFYILHIFCVHHCKLPSPELPEEEISIWIQRGLKFLLQVFSVPNFAGSVPTMSIRSLNDIQPDPFPIPGIWQSPGPTTLNINLHFFNVNQPPSLLTLPPPHTYFTILYTINLLSIYNHLKAFQDLRTISWKGSIKFQNMCLHLPATTRSISVTRPGWQVSVFCSRLKLPPSGLEPYHCDRAMPPFSPTTPAKKRFRLNLDINQLSSLRHR